jgi:copper ion binding protein
VLFGKRLALAQELLLHRGDLQVGDLPGGRCAAPVAPGCAALAPGMPHAGQARRAPSQSCPSRPAASAAADTSPPPPFPAAQLQGVKVDAQQRLIEVLAPVASLVLRSAVLQAISGLGLLILRTSAGGAPPPQHDQQQREQQQVPEATAAGPEGAAAGSVQAAATRPCGAPALLLAVPPQPSSARLQVSGMSCSACVACIEAGLRQVPGVGEASVALLLQQCAVQYDASLVGPKQIAAAVQGMGFEALLLEAGPLAAGGRRAAAAEATVKLAVAGLSCASCVAAVESALAARCGVESATLALLTGQAVVRYQPGRVGARDIIELVQVGRGGAGAGAGWCPHRPGPGLARLLRPPWRSAPWGCSGGGAALAPPCCPTP